MNIATDPLTDALLQRTLDRIELLREQLGSEAAEEPARRIGFLLGVLASSAEIDFLRARRELDGVRMAIDLVVDELRARGAQIALSGPVPNVVGGPVGHWRLPRAVMGFLWATASSSDGRAEFVAGTANAIRLDWLSRTGSATVPPDTWCELRTELSALAPGATLAVEPGRVSLNLPAGWLEVGNAREPVR